MSKYCFKTDDDCHWYMIPVESSDLFSYLLGKGIESDDYSEFCSTFEHCRVDSPKHYIFENPKEII